MKWQAATPLPAMLSRPQGGLLDLPLETHIEVCRWLDPRTRWHMRSSCRAFAAADRLAPLSSVHAQIASDQVASFDKWLQENGSRITALHIQGQALHSQHAKSALWAALSAPKQLQQLQHLQLDMPLSPEDEAAVLHDVCANAPTLSSLHLNYQRPLSHARKGNVVCFCAHSSAAPWAAAAGQLRALRVTGACFCTMDNIAQLRGLTSLQVSCCNTTNPGAQLAQLLQQLPHLQQLTYTSSAPAAVDYAIAAALAAHSSLAHLELHNFAAPASSSSSSVGATTAATWLGVAAEGAAVVSPTVVNALLTLALQRLRSLKLVDFSGSLRLLPMLAAATSSSSSSSKAGVQLQQLQLARSRQDGFMPALLAGMFSDSGTDSDSEDSDGGSNDLDSSSDTDCSEDAMDEAGGGCCVAGSWFGSCCGGGRSSSKVAAAAATAAATMLRSNSSSLQRCSYGSIGSATGRARSGIAPLALLHSLLDLDLSGFGLCNIGPVFSLTLLTSLKLGPGLGAVGSSQHMNRLDSSSLADIELLQQLQYLDVSHNKLTCDSLLLLQCLTGLTYLSLAGNDLSTSSIASSEHVVSGCSSKGAVREEARACCGGDGGSSSSSCCLNDGSSSEVEAATSKKSSSSLQAGAACATSTASLQAAECSWSMLSSNSSNSRTYGSPVLCNNNSSSRSSVSSLPFAKLRHLEVSGCSLGSIPGLTVALGHTAVLPAGLTYLNAGTSLRHIGNGVWAKKANQLTAACVASLAELTKLQDLEVAANVPAWCYAGFRGLRQLTRLVVQDYAAAGGLFGLDDAAMGRCKELGSSSSSIGTVATCASADASCCFPHLVELGVMLRGAAGAAAMRQLSVSCRALHKLSIYQDLTIQSSSGSCCSRAAPCSSSSWHCEALAGLPRLQQLSLQPPADLRVLTGLTGLRQLQLLGPEAGWTPERTEAGQPGTASAGAAVGAPVAACCAGADTAAAACAGACTAAGLGAACCAGSLVPAGNGVLPCPTTAAGAGGRCCGGDAPAAAAAGGAGAGPCCGGDGSAAPAAAAAVGSGCGGGGAAVADMQLGVQFVTDVELLGLGVWKNLTHLGLQHVAFDDGAVDELQKLLPCTRISV